MRPERGGSRSPIPLLPRVIAALVLVGLVPIALSTVLISRTSETLDDQVQAMHLVAVRAIATAAEAEVEILTVLGRTIARHPAIVEDPGSQAAREFLAALPQAQDEIAVAALYRVDGPAPELALLARQLRYADLTDVLLRAEDPRHLVLQRQGGALWLRLRVPLGDEGLALFLVALVEDLDAVLGTVEIGDEAELVLASRDGEVLAGDAESLGTFPAKLVDDARQGQVRSGVSPFPMPGGDSLIGAWAEVAGSPWFVLSRQPKARAKAASQQILRTSWSALASSLVLTGLLSWGAHRTIIRPLRRLAKAQRRLAGGDPKAGSGGEIAALEESFALLERSLHDREALSRIFLDRYQVIDVLGAGAMGTVFEGRDPRLERRVALKTLKIESEDSPETRDRGELREAADRLVKEAVTLARLQHPHIVTVFDVLREGDSAFIAMELVRGESLEALLWRRHRLRPERVVPVVIALLKALDAAHQAGFVHHDVKPGNVLLGDDGAIKVTDFGVSELLSQVHAGRDSVCGTPGYLAPETLLRQGYTARSDLFSVGVVLYECLTGQRPFQGDNLREILVATAVAEPTPLEDLAPETPAKLRELVSKLLAKSPEGRPASAGEILQVLEQMADDEDWEWSPDLVRGADGEREIDASDRIHTVLLPTLERRADGSFAGGTVR